MKNLKLRIEKLVNNIGNLSTEYSAWLTNKVMSTRISNNSSDQDIYDQIYYYYDGDCDGDQWEEVCFGTSNY